MKKTILTLLVPGLLLTALPPAMAENQSGLTPEQLQHERKMTELRKQQEILEVKHSQAVLLRECQEMGIDCRGQSLEVIESQQDSLDEQFQALTEQAPTVNASDMPFSLTPGNKSDKSPRLDAIQNQSAQLTLSGSTEWALVGDTIGDWRVVHIDASKVRVKHTGNDKTKTLVLNW